MSQTYFSSNQNSSQDTARRFQCRHIFTEGRRCGSPCLRNEDFCYFHHATRRPVEDAAARKARLASLDFTWPEDRAALQLSLCQVLERVASNDLDPRRAGLLLYGLQIASLNLPRPVEETASRPFVEEIVHDERHGALAPRSTVESLEPKGTAQRLLEEMRAGRYAAEQSAAQAGPAPKPVVLPAIQAAADPLYPILPDEPFNAWPIPKLRHLDRSQTVLSFGVAESPPYFVRGANALHHHSRNSSKVLQRQVLVDKRNRHAAFAHAARHAFDRVVPHIAGAEDPR